MDASTPGLNPDVTKSPRLSAEPDLRRAIFRFHLDADALEKGGRENPASAHDDRIVPDLHSLSVLLDLNIVLADPLDTGLKQDLEAAGLPRCLHVLAIFHFGARKGLAPVRQSDG